MRRSFKLQARNKVLELGSRTLVMGILNATPDSFSDKGRYFTRDAAIERAWEMAKEGADILDIGGESTRPGSLGISAQEEMDRVLPILDALGSRYPLPISIDTSKSEVARSALELGASIINDITSFRKDPGIGSVAAEYGAAVVLMHMRGEPHNMQSIPPSPDIWREIENWAQDTVARAQNSGVSSNRIVLDPGIGFGKTPAQNLEIIGNLHRLAESGFPILMGTSRKSFIGSILKKPASELVWGTSATVAASIIFGAHIVRVHDVAAIREVADVTDVIVQAKAFS